MTNTVYHLRRSWQAYKENFSTLMAAILLSVVPSALIIGLGILVASDFSLGQANNFITQIYFSQGSGFWASSSAPYLMVPGWFLLFGLAAGLLSAYLSSGLYGVSLSALRSKTGKANISVFFDSVRSRGISLVESKVLLAFIFAGIIIIILALGLAMSILGMLVGGMFASSDIFFSFLLIALAVALIIVPFFTVVSPSVVSGKSVSNAFEESVRIGRKDYWGVAFILLSVAVLQFAVFGLASFFAIIGIIFSLVFVSPFANLLISSLYIEKSATKASAVEIKPKARKKSARTKATKKKAVRKKAARKRVR